MLEKAILGYIIVDNAYNIASNNFTETHAAHTILKDVLDFYKS